MVVTNDEFNGCGMQLRAERERLGYTRDQAAERADITSRYLAAIELGEKIPKADVLVKLIRGMERPVFTLCRLLSSISRSVYCSVRGNLFVILYPRFHIRFSFTSYLFHIFSCRAIGCALSEDYSILRSSMQNYIGKCAVYFSKFF